MKQPEVQSAPEPQGAIPEELLHASPLSASDSADAHLKALVEAVIYITDEPLSADQIAIALSQPAEKVGRVLEELTAEYNKPEHGLTVREIAGGYKMSTKPEHHEAIRAFVKNLKPALKLSLAALETLALIAYKQPITAPEVMDVRGVQGAGVLKTLLDRKLIATSGRKQVVGKPILYKTTKEFLVQFGLKDLSELPTLKEFEELGRLSMGDEEMPEEPPAAAESSADEVAAQQIEPSVTE
jgi:segregation and condensation protein B